MTGKKRRTVKTISEYLSSEQVLSLVTGKQMKYATTPEFYHKRDRALMSLAFLTAGRINEVLKLRKSQFNFNESPHYILVENMHVSKRKRELIKKYGNHITKRWSFILPLSPDPNIYEYPKMVQLVPFTRLVVEYLELLEPDEPLFQMGTRWAWEIIRKTTRLFPNWFRSQAEMWYGSNILRDSVKLAKFVGVVRPEQVAHYIGFDYKETLKEPQKIK